MVELGKIFFWEMPTETNLEHQFQEIKCNSAQRNLLFRTSQHASTHTEYNINDSKNKIKTCLWESKIDEICPIWE